MNIKTSGGSQLMGRGPKVDHRNTAKNNYFSLMRNTSSHKNKNKKMKRRDKNTWKSVLYASWRSSMKQFNMRKYMWMQKYEFKVDKISLCFTWVFFIPVCTVYRNLNGLHNSLLNELKSSTSSRVTRACSNVEYLQTHSNVPHSQGLKQNSNVAKEEPDM